MLNGEPDIRDNAAELLAWYAEMGVDIALADEPQDRFAEAPPQSTSASTTSSERALPGIDKPAQTRPTASPPSMAALTKSQDAAVQDAREAARSAKTLDELRAILETYEGVGLRRTATRLVFSDGNPQSRVMFVGEAPGKDEDREGLAFVGRAGQLLDRMLHAIGLDRKAAYIANVIPWRPPGNRTPTPQETQLCLPFIQRQIELANPDFLVLLGGSAAAALTGSKDGILRLRGRWMDYETGTRTIRALATLHPAYLLRTPSQKKLAWRDLRSLKAELDANA
ncbi:uracil-DNA glycosylase [Flaviflagellibacter deserti]|uniref:Type-4 uracil-DNA glycosylase n=1 Tax=Flaviflagellibacter deserti TaxID=2267266 RepID=A0ABV9YWX1_9HYPH